MCGRMENKPLSDQFGKTIRSKVKISPEKIDMNVFIKYLFPSLLFLPTRLSDLKQFPPFSSGLRSTYLASLREGEELGRSCNYRRVWIINKGRPEELELNSFFYDHDENK